MIVDYAFAYIVAFDIMLNDDIKPRSVDECRRRMDWSNWKQESKLNSIRLQNVRCLGM